MIGLAGLHRAFADGGIRFVALKGYTHLMAGALKALTYRHTIHLGDVRIILRADPNCSYLLRWNRDWKTQLISEVLRLRSGLFLDVGANIGDTLLDYLAEPRRGGYIGFEPILRCADYVQTIIRDNDLHDCTLVPAALFDQNTVLTLYRKPDSLTDSGASLVSDLRPAAKAELDIVSCYRFDDIREALGISKRIGMVKIDVEGAEMAVLMGMQRALRADRPWVLCEVLDRDGAADTTTFRQRREALTGFVHGLDYAILHVERSPNDKAVRGLTPVNSFPCRPWIDEVSQQNCDYLLVPLEQQPNVASLLSSGPREHERRGGVA
jgi:FkbM family methyltransferase